jgi:hypothetical protein
VTHKIIASEVVKNSHGKVAGYLTLVEDENGRRWVDVDFEPATRLSPETTLYLSKALRDWGNRAKLWNTTL